MNLTKKEFLNRLTEDLNQVNQGQPNKKPNFLSTVTNPTVVKTATDNINQLSNLKKKADSMGITGANSVDEEFDGSKEYANKTEYLKAMIDHLMDDRFGITVFSNPPAPEIYQHKAAYNPDMASFFQRVERAKEEMLVSPEKGEIALNNVYLSLQDYINKKKMNEENFVDSEMFRIIAEAEAPTLTKGEFLSFVKEKA